MTQSQWNALTSLQQSEAANLADSFAFNLWTDSGVTGLNSTLHVGGINSSTPSVAANWGAPTSGSYDSASSYDYYAIVGWSANLGTSWSAATNNLKNGYFSGIIYFGKTAVAYNYAGGGPRSLAPVGVWSSSAATGLAGSGGLPSSDALTLYTVPEPATLTLAIVGGISMLFFRRRKS